MPSPKLHKGGNMAGKISARANKDRFPRLTAQCV